MKIQGNPLVHDRNQTLHPSPIQMQTSFPEMKSASVLAKDEASDFYHVPEDSPEFSPSAASSAAPAPTKHGKQIEKVILLYNDGSFESFNG